MIIDELNKKIADIEILANDKASTIESKVSDLTDGILMVADAVDIIPEMVDEKITAITKEFSAIKDSVSKVKAQKGDSGRDGIDGLDGLDGKDGKDGSPDKPKDIADKLNTLENVIDPKVIKGSGEYVNKADLNRTISTLENQTRFLIQSNASKGSGTGTTTTINGLSGDITLSEGNNVTLNTSGSDIEINADFTQTGKYMTSGGAVWSGTGLTYDVSMLSYFFNGNKTASATSVTLDPSDPTDNRLDALVVDESGTVTVITGDASASPISPAIPEDQLLVQYFLVEAGSTTPTVVQDAIYLDNSEWTTSTYTTATPATGTINFNGTSSPKQGTKDIEADTDLRLGARFVRSSAIDLQSYTMFSVWVRFTAPVATNKSLNVRFENTSGALIGNTVNLFNYGLNRNIVNTWQLVIVPVPAFGNITSVKGLKVIMAGGTVGVKTKWDLDYMLLTNGSTPQANVPTLSFYKNGTGIAAQSGINLIEGTGVTITAVNNPTNNRVDYTINASGGGTPAGSDTQIQYNNGGVFGADALFTRDVATGNANLAKDAIQQSPITFTGSGLDDLQIAPTFSGSTPTTYTITISSTGTPDTFNWTDGTNSGTNVPMNLMGNTLSNGLIIWFMADTGHTNGDSWSWTYTKPEKFAFKLTDDFGGNFGSGMPGILQKYENTSGGINREARNGIFETSEDGEQFQFIEQSITDNATYSGYRLLVDGIYDSYTDLSTNNNSVYMLQANSFSIKKIPAVCGNFLFM